MSYPSQSSFHLRSALISKTLNISPSSTLIMTHPATKQEVTKHVTLSSLCIFKLDENKHTMLTRAKRLSCLHNAVLNTWELLELIVLQCPIETILLQRLTSRRWNEVIMTSRSIKARLFLVTERIPTALTGPWVFDCSTEAWLPLKSVKTSTINMRNWLERQRRVRPCLLNEHVFTTVPTRKPKTRLDLASKCERIVFKRRPNLLKLSTPTSLGGSVIGDMLVCQPPITFMEFDFSFQQSTRSLGSRGAINPRWRKYVSRHIRVPVFNSRGVRIFDVAYAILEVLAGTPGRCRRRMMKCKGIESVGVCWLIGALLLTEKEKQDIENSVERA